MDEGERDHGPDQPVPEHGETRSEEPEPEWPVPALLQELAATDVSDEPEPIPEEELVDEDDGVAPRPRVRTSTKVVLVAAAWLLLTLFLVGRFSGGPPPEGSTRLDQFATDEEDEEAEDGEEAATEVDAADTPVGEALAGDYADGAAIYGDGTSGGGVAGGGSGVYAGVPADGSAGVGGGGAAPGTTTSPAPAPGFGGGAATTTSPAGGGTTDTTAASGGGSGTPTTTTGAPPPDAPAPAATVHISWNGNKFFYDRPTFSVPSGSVVRMVNDTAESHTWKMATWNVSIPPGGYVDRTITATGQFGCDTHRYMTGRITVT